jgi:uncharacterized iron-regulated membrane protein
MRLRRALFQAHLWTGLTLGLYVLVISLSGSAIVFRHEMDRWLCPRIILVTPTGARLSDAQLLAAAKRATPPRLSSLDPRIEVRGPRVPGAAVEVRYILRRGSFERLFDPYTGRNLGDALACEPALVSRLADLHDDLLGGRVGRAVNGVAALLVALLCLTGAVVWWPGRSRWWRSMTLHRHVTAQRFMWDLHSALGFWMCAGILLWAASGIYFAFPSLFGGLGDDVIDAIVTLHFGRAFGPWVKVLWVLLGFAPTALLVTGALMWWNRVLRRAIAMRQRRSEARCQYVGSAVQLHDSDSPRS